MRTNVRLGMFASVSTLALLCLPGAASAQCVTNAALDDLRAGCFDGAAVLATDD